MNRASLAPVAGRVLLIDGDGLAYYCAGKDDSPAAEARIRMVEKIESARLSAGCASVLILLTGSGSHKGWRYALASVKPYQGQRSDSRRPSNWRFLREFMESGQAGPILITYTAEADDLFAAYPGDCVIYTQDKDMRMIPGTHLDWITHQLVTVPKAAWEVVSGDKVYGRKWFWLQMLHGDSVDNIPGLPRPDRCWYTPDGEKIKGRAGEVLAGALLDSAGPAGALGTVAGLYKGLYGWFWLPHLLEQAALLWMRREPENWADCCNPGGPLHELVDHENFSDACLIIQERIEEIRKYAQAKDN